MAAEGMKVETVQVYRKLDNKKLGYLWFSKTMNRLAFAINPTSQDLRWNAMETFRSMMQQINSLQTFEVVKEGAGRQPATLNQHRRLLQERDSYYLKRIVDLLPVLEIPKFLTSINDYGDWQPDRIYGKYKMIEIKDTEINIIKDTLRTNNYDYKQLVGVSSEVKPRVKCPLCAMFHSPRLEVKVERVEGKKAYAGKGSAFVLCSQPYGGGEYKVNWNSVEFAIVQTERDHSGEEDYW